jgi:glucose-1-phosphate adenylyltransferase
MYLFLYIALTTIIFLNYELVEGVAMKHKAVSIILAGGKGERLQPLTEKRCKPAINLGKHRLIDVPIAHSINADIDNIFILSQFLSHSLSNYIDNTYLNDPFEGKKIQVLASSGSEYEGTADAVRKNMHQLEAIECEYIVILSGDQLYHMDIEKLIEQGEKSGADLVIATSVVNKNNAKRLGILRVNKKSMVEEFVEKPQEQEVLKELCYDAKKEQYLASMGIYVFKKQALIDALEHGGMDFGKHIIPRLVEQGNCAAFIFKDYWEDIGTISSYYETAMNATESFESYRFYDEKFPMYGQRLSLPSTKIFGAQITHCIICDGSYILAKKLENTIVGLRSYIKENTVIKRSILMGNQLYSDIDEKDFPQNHWIGKNCVIEKCIIDEHTRIGDNVTLRNENNHQEFQKGDVLIKEGIIIVPSGAVVPDNFTL